MIHRALTHGLAIVLLATVFGACNKEEPTTAVIIVFLAMALLGIAFLLIMIPLLQKQALILIAKIPAGVDWLQQSLLTLLAISTQLMFPAMTLRVLDLFPNVRGTVASAHSFFNLMMSSLMMGVLAPWLSQSMQRLASASFAVSLAGLLLWRLSLWRERRAAHTRAG